MNSSTKLIFLGSLAVTAVAFLVVPRQKSKITTTSVSPATQKAYDAFTKLPPNDTSALESTIKMFEKSPEQAVQNRVTQARMTLGYAYAQKKDFATARKVFTVAEKEHKGTTAMNPDWGTATDQAAYQAMVCLQAQGKIDEAKAEYRKFLKERKFSPLVTAVYRRLERLNGGNADPADTALIEAATQAQDERVKHEIVICGPKCLAMLLSMDKKPVPKLEDLEKACGTTSEGTTLEGLAKGMTELGYKVKGRELNRADFSRLEAPAMWLTDNHFVLITKIGVDRAEVFDPLAGATRSQTLPPLGDLNFRATILQITKG